MLYIIILVLGVIGSVIGPWWLLPLVACVACAFRAKSSGQAFAVSSSAGVTLWVGFSLILMFSGKENLVEKVAGIFSGASPLLGSFPATGLVLFIVTLVAGLTTGFAGLAGKHLYKIVKG